MKKFTRILSVLLTLIIVSGSISIISASATEYHSLGLIADSTATVQAHLNTSLSVPSTLPSAVDNTANFPAPGDQGSQGSCTAWAVGYALKSAQEIHKRSWSKTAESHLFSPSFIYNQINGGYDNGSSISAAMNLLTTQGVCSRVYCPYDDSDYITQPSNNAKAAAALYVASSWDTIQGISQIKSRIASGDGVVIGVKVYPDFDAVSSSNQVYDTISGTSRGNHAICLVGYNNSKNAFKFINSWGDSWGIGGYGWISYNLVNSASVNVHGSGIGYILNLTTSDNYIMGDINKDGKVNSTDARLALRYAAKLETPTAEQFALADVNGDAKVNSTDAQLINKYAAKLITQFPLYD